MITQPNTRSNVDIVKLLTFSKKAGKVTNFLIVYKLYIRIRMKKAVVEK